MMNLGPHFKFEGATINPHCRQNLLDLTLKIFAMTSCLKKESQI